MVAQNYTPEQRTLAGVPHEPFAAQPLRIDDAEFTGFVITGSSCEKQLVGISIIRDTAPAEQQRPQSRNRNNLPGCILHYSGDFSVGEIDRVNLAVIDVPDHQAAAKRSEICGSQR